MELGSTQFRTGRIQAQATGASSAATSFLHGELLDVGGAVVLAMERAGFERRERRVAPLKLEKHEGPGWPISRPTGTRLSSRSASPVPGSGGFTCLRPSSASTWWIRVLNVVPRQGPKPGCHRRAVPGTERPHEGPILSGSCTPAIRGRSALERRTASDGRGAAPEGLAAPREAAQSQAARVGGIPLRPLSGTTPSTWCTPMPPSSKPMTDAAM